MTLDVGAVVIRHTLRVPLPDGPNGDGSVVARQLDVALLSVGFKLSGDLFAGFAGLSVPTAIDTAVALLSVVRGMVGDHVEHNTYFVDFPRNVPDTDEFWMTCVRSALVEDVLSDGGATNLLELPLYGRYQHSYADMAAVHQAFIAATGDRITLLQRGFPLAAEVSRLYLALAARPVVLGAEEQEALRVLARVCAADAVQPTEIPVRETRALINAVRITHDVEPLLDTATDVLRLACELCGGDVSLVEPTRFTGLTRRQRKVLLAGLDEVLADDPAKLGDVHRHRERWKRLGERLHPHEYPQWTHAAKAFAVARGELRTPTFAARAEELLAVGDVVGAADALSPAPGLLLRAVDRLLRTCPGPAEQDAVLNAVAAALPRASGRMLLSTRAHVSNRRKYSGRSRIMVNQRNRGRAAPDTRPLIDFAVLDRLAVLLDAEIRGRIPLSGRVVLDPAMRSVALPLTGKTVAGGFGVLPRGSVSAVDSPLLRFFVYWKQRTERTDLDLSALLLDQDYKTLTAVSYTNLSAAGGKHSGDITEAASGASEFIDIHLDEVPARIVIPQVDVFCGEVFAELEESFFGFMLREPVQGGLPFEPRTVRMKSELRGTGRVALPVAFVRGDDGRWRAFWLHLHLTGFLYYNRVENNSVTTRQLVAALIKRDYLKVDYLLGLLADNVELVAPTDVGDQPVTYLGLETPSGLPDGSTVITPAKLADLVPD